MPASTARRGGVCTATTTSADVGVGATSWSFRREPPEYGRADHGEDQEADRDRKVGTHRSHHDRKSEATVVTLKARIRVMSTASDTTSFACGLVTSLACGLVARATLGDLLLPVATGVVVGRQALVHRLGLEAVQDGINRSHIQ